MSRAAATDKTTASAVPATTKAAKTAKTAKAKVATVAGKAVVPRVAGRERLMNLLLAPHVTEKASLAQQSRNQYTFRVRRDATRTEVRAAVELMFEVKVEGVQVLNEPGKERRFGGRKGRTQDWKKAYVRLVAGQSIDFESQASAKVK